VYLLAQNAFGRSNADASDYRLLTLFVLFFPFGRVPRCITGAPVDDEALAIAAGLLVPTLGSVVHSSTADVAISDDAVETGSLFRRRSLPLNQISHRREHQKDAGDDYIVRYTEFVAKSIPTPVPNAPRQRPLKIAINHFAFDSEFRRFVERFPEHFLNPDQPQTRANHSRADGRS
jgi:hypothetical protein